MYTFCYIFYLFVYSIVNLETAFEVEHTITTLRSPVEYYWQLLLILNYTYTKSPHCSRKPFRV